MSKRSTPHISRRADEAVQVLTTAFSAPSEAVLMERGLDEIREWLRERFGQLGVDKHHEIEMARNSYQKTHGLGLESIAVKVLHGETKKELLLEDEWKSPTLGVMTPNLLPDAPMGITPFDIGLAEGEEITNVSKMPLLVYGNDPLRVGFEAALRANEKLSVSGLGSQVHFVIANQATNPEKAVDLQALKEKGLSPEGIYACRYTVVGV